MRRNTSIFIVFVIVLFCAIITEGTAGQHREITAQLKGDTPLWYQPKLKDGYPIGCGPAAWAILYAYWSLNHPGVNLFPGYVIDTTSGGADDPPVTAAMERIAYFVEMEYTYKTVAAGDINDGSKKYLTRGSRAKLGSTQNAKMCQGIRFAQEKGYSYSRCFDLRGSEFQKFDHVAAHLNANRPVIIAMSTKGHKATNHFVVVEKVKKIQEKVGNSWRDRDVWYYVNYGWGGKKDWISARQVGVNTSQITTVTHVYLVEVSKTQLKEAADANEARCNEWCRANRCSMCSSLPECGPGYKTVKTFTEAGKNWYACMPRDTKRVRASEDNRRACEDWCRANSATEGCVRCSQLMGCGTGYKTIHSWTGYGENWYACRKWGTSDRDESSEDHHRACEDWCKVNPGCVKCARAVGCGAGFTAMKSWTGYGDNWYACKHTKQQEESLKHKKACEDWCKANSPPCVMCSTYANCGPGYSTIKSWTGYGENWHACEVRKTRDEESSSNKEDCLTWCRNHSKCIGCSRLPGCGVGNKPMKSWTGRGDNWYACEKR